jgi:hypothetical protein
VTARGDFKQYERALQDRGGRATPAEMRELRALWEAWDRGFRAWEEQGRPSPSGVWLNRERPPEWKLLEVRFASVSTDLPGRLSGSLPTPGKSRHRPPDPLPLDTIERLETELAKRRDAGKPRRGRLTQSAIARRLGLERHRVQQAEALLKVGWELPRSHPEFSANDGVVRWPSVTEARRILALERCGSSHN